ncbi:MAG TPA: hypothetical protein VMC41_02005 [Candidatus Nanoarchaeia archaeon]|nr:hypothetical protein [Candidatus Nanoarchaeia archaeon]
MVVIIKKIILAAVILALVFGFVYSVSQQVLRQSANDPQIQIAEDSAAALNAGDQPRFLKNNVYGMIDSSKSLAPFLINFDAAGKPVDSTAALNGQTPIPPAGVFAYAKAHGQNRVTWQTPDGTRLAAVIVYYSGNGGGYALAGRSLLEVEKRESNLEFLTFWAWLFSVLVLAALIFASEKMFASKK